MINLTECGHSHKFTRSICLVQKSYRFKFFWSSPKKIRHIVQVTFLPRLVGLLCFYSLIYDAVCSLN